MFSHCCDLSYQSTFFCVIYSLQKSFLMIVNSSVMLRFLVTCDKCPLLGNSGYCCSSSSINSGLALEFRGPWIHM